MEHQTVGSSKVYESLHLLMLVLCVHKSKIIHTSIKFYFLILIFHSLDLTYPSMFSFGSQLSYMSPIVSGDHLRRQKDLDSAYNILLATLKVQLYSTVKDRRNYTRAQAKTKREINDKNSSTPSQHVYVPAAMMASV